MLTREPYRTVADREHADGWHNSADPACWACEYGGIPNGTDPFTLPLDFVSIEIETDPTGTDDYWSMVRKGIDDDR